LVGCGEQDKAYRIGSALLWAIDNDRTWHDGRLRNAYAAGVVANGPVKLPGWWDNTQNKWLEDRYQVGSDIGNMAWAMLALLSIDDVSTGSRFRDGAARLGTWVAQWADTRGTGGFTGGTFGHEPTPEVRTWKSTEHNTDLAAAFGLLAIRTGDSRWRDMATTAEHFVNAMWDPACACFAAGTAEDGVTRNPIVALDAQVWPLTALPGAAKKFASAIFARQDWEGKVVDSCNRIPEVAGWGVLCHKCPRVTDWVRVGYRSDQATTLFPIATSWRSFVGCPRRTGVQSLYDDKRTSVVNPQCFPSRPFQSFSISICPQGQRIAQPVYLQLRKRLVRSGNCASACAIPRKHFDTSGKSPALFHHRSIDDPPLLKPGFRRPFTAC